MDDLLSRDQGFEKVEEQVCCLYSKLDLDELDYFKVLV